MWDRFTDIHFISFEPHQILFRTTKKFISAKFCCQKVFAMLTLLSFPVGKSSLRGPEKSDRSEKNLFWLAKVYFFYMGFFYIASKERINLLNIKLA